MSLRLASAGSRGCCGGHGRISSHWKRRRHNGARRPARSHVLPRARRHGSPRPSAGRPGAWPAAAVPGWLRCRLLPPATSWPASARLAGSLHPRLTCPLHGRRRLHPRLPTASGAPHSSCAGRRRTARPAPQPCAQPSRSRRGRACAVCGARCFPAAVAGTWAPCSARPSWYSHQVTRLKGCVFEVRLSSVSLRIL